MTYKPKIPPHQFLTADPIRRGDRYHIRYCSVCQLPETRTDIHPADSELYPPVPDHVRQQEAARYGEDE